MKIFEQVVAFGTFCSLRTQLELEKSWEPWAWAACAKFFIALILGSIESSFFEKVSWFNFLIVTCLLSFVIKLNDLQFLPPPPRESFHSELTTDSANLGPADDRQNNLGTATVPIRNFCKMFFNRSKIGRSWSLITSTFDAHYRLARPPRFGIYFFAYCVLGRSAFSSLSRFIAEISA